MEQEAALVEIKSDSVRRLERNNLILVLLGTIVSCYFQNARLTLSFLAGGTMTVVNLRLIRLIVAALTGEKTPSKGKLVAQVLLKFAGMIGVLAFVMLVLRPAPIPFLLGLSTIVVAIMIEGILGVFRSE
jgi:ATP synthase I subunit